MNEWICIIWWIFLDKWTNEWIYIIGWIYLDNEWMNKYFLYNECS